MFLNIAEILTIALKWQRCRSNYIAVVTCGTSPDDLDLFLINLSLNSNAVILCHFILVVETKDFNCHCTYSH